nr:hypothetical protein [Clostridium paraputrificum]
MNRFSSLSEDEIKEKFRQFSEEPRGPRVRKFIYDILLKNPINREKFDFKKNLNLDVEKIKSANNSGHKNQTIASDFFIYGLVAHILGDEKTYIELLSSDEFQNGIFDTDMKKNERWCKELTSFYGVIRYDIATIKIHEIMVLRKYDKPIYTVVTRDREAMSKNEIRTFKWDYCSMDEFIYSVLCDLYGTKRIGQYYKKNDEFLLKMYYSLYLYLTEDENKEEYKKLALNYAQKAIESDYFDVVFDFIMLLDLSITFPEVFGDIIDKPHKIVKADESLLDFNKVKAVTPLSNVEKDLIKNLKDEDIRILMEKPKK